MITFLNILANKKYNNFKINKKRLSLKLKSRMKHTICTNIKNYKLYIR